MVRDAPTNDALARLLLGPTRSLKAPTIRCGRVMIVGFIPDAYQELFG